MSDEERHHTSKEARRRIAGRPATARSGEASVARYLGAQYYRERTVKEQRQHGPDRGTAHDLPAADAPDSGAAAPFVVVGVDGRRPGIEALRWALAEAERRDCEVRAVLVDHLPRLTTVGRSDQERTALSVLPDQRCLERLRETVTAVLGDRQESRLTADVVQGTGVAEVLCTTSRDAELLVLGTSERHGLARAVLGGVTRRCVDQASCPVVVVPAAGATGPAT